VDRAGRLTGAFRRCGRPELAHEILTTVKSAVYDVRETDPFAPRQIFVELPAAAPPNRGKSAAMWESMRGEVLEVFPKPPGRPEDREKYRRLVENIYCSDAYYSLSIEGYSVSPELVEWARAGNWGPANHDAVRQSRDALAARGYWEAFRESRQSQNHRRRKSRPPGAREPP
jgi:hypothetical protein